MLPVSPVVQTFPTTRRYLIGVSGGRDSVVLLHLLSSLGYRKLIVCHLNHRLRGRSSNADARFVERLSAKYEYPCIIGNVEVAERAEQNKESIETAARNARYEFFKKIARQKRCDTIFLAHHADDQVETFLFNLFRGAGSAGLGSMRVETRHGSLRVVRPMLGVWRSEIDAYVEAHRLKFREDATNTDTAHQRNRMRHQILPLLETHFGREIRKSVWRSAEILSAENEWLESLIEPPGNELSVPELRKMPVAKQRRLIFTWLKTRAVPNAGFSEVERVRSLLEAADAPAKVNLPGDRHARRRAKKIFLE
ncbi:MAG: tRNA lysidine(34) synthetase TilS [Verrucomicrobiota bacterium]